MSDVIVNNDTGEHEVNCCREEDGADCEEDNIAVLISKLTSKVYFGRKVKLTSRTDSIQKGRSASALAQHTQQPQALAHSSSSRKSSMLCSTRAGNLG